MTGVLCGADVFFEERISRFAGKALGVLCHAASVTSNLVHVLHRFEQAKGIELRAVFAPEHGLFAAAQDMESVGGTAWRGVPVHSLYGAARASLRPAADSLFGLDAFVIDLQDVGARYYTFAATMALCMEACRDAGVAVIVLDRPNPIGGVEIEGPSIDAGYESFVGLYPIPVRHGMTIGELARLYNTAFGIGCDLTVVGMRGWRREMHFGGTGLPWVLPSPNMPAVDTALVYPGMCLVEGTNLSEGRGTTRPFELIGAPWLNGEDFATRLNALGLPGVRFRACGFTPGFQKHAGQACGGVQLHVTDRDTFRPFLTGVHVVRTARQTDPHRFAWRTQVYEFEEKIPAFDLLTGGERVRHVIEQDGDVDALVPAWRDACGAFDVLRRDALLYH